MSLYIARHGETDWNRAGRYQSRTDVPLNETGVRQAHALAALLQERRVTFCDAWCSPLSRAHNTAKILVRESIDPLASAGSEPISIRIESAFVELSLGEFEGRFTEELQEQYGDTFMKWRDSGFIDAAPDGESMQTAVDRVTPALDEIRSRARDQDVLIVAHQGINMAIKSALEGHIDVERLVQHRQGNDEIDVWDEARGTIVERIRVSDAGLS